MHTLSLENLKIVFVYADTEREWNCSQWRSLTPSDALNRSRKHQAKLIHVSGFADYLNPAIQEWVMNADLIIFQRNLINETIFESIQYFKGMGKPIVADLDDAYHILPWSNPAHKFWIQKEGGNAVNMLERGLSMMDGLLAPNRLLLSDWEYIVPGYFMNNFAERTWWEDLPPRKKMKEEVGLEDKIVIGWGGSYSHYDSWHGANIMEAVRLLTDKYDNITWMICGNDKRIYDDLPVPSDRKYYQPGVLPNAWPRIVKRFDIGVAPLFGPYDQRRSWIKGLEYGLAGVPWVGTYGEPYRDLALYGELVKNTEEEWYSAIEKKILDLETEQEQAKNFIPLFREYFADNQTAHYENVFRQIISRHQEGNIVLPNIYFVNPEKGMSA